MEADSPVVAIPPAIPTETDKRIAEHVMKEMVDGACIQLGIGGMPNVVGTLLVESDLKDLGCHTEMLTDAYFHLFEAGKLTNKRKSIDMGKTVSGLSI
ncbi:MAG TPA: hypothetical protein VN426_02480 [Syntrophomonadaceae bacterium]|nr:hypothetical protein [Syntrophomonadaceae bacterium]